MLWRSHWVKSICEKKNALGSLKYTFNVGSLTSVILLELVIVISVLFKKAVQSMNEKCQVSNPHIKITHSFIFMPHTFPCSSKEKHKNSRVNYRVVTRENSTL